MRSASSSTPRSLGWNPYRVTRRHDRAGAPLTAAQHACLEALVHLCPRPGSDASGREVATSAGLRFGSVVLTLRNLERMRLATEHAPASEDEEATWSPTLFGRARARRRNDPAVRRP